jgi:hypothetical protein
LLNIPYQHVARWIRKHAAIIQNKLEHESKSVSKQRVETWSNWMNDGRTFKKGQSRLDMNGRGLEQR